MYIYMNFDRTGSAEQIFASHIRIMPNIYIIPFSHRCWEEGRIASDMHWFNDCITHISIDWGPTRLEGDTQTHISYSCNNVCCAAQAEWKGTDGRENMVHNFKHWLRVIISRMKRDESHGYRLSNYYLLWLVADVGVVWESVKSTFHSDVSRGRCVLHRIYTKPTQ